MSQPQEDKPKQVFEYIGSETAFRIYVNHSEMGLSNWDIRIRFGEITGQRDTVPIVKDHGTIVMAPAHAKAILEALQKTIHMYEEKVGEIDLARIQQAAKTTA